MHVCTSQSKDRNWSIETKDVTLMKLTLQFVQFPLHHKGYNYKGGKYFNWSFSNRTEAIIWKVFLLHRLIWADPGWLMTSNHPYRNTIDWLQFRRGKKLLYSNFPTKSFPEIFIYKILLSNVMINTYESRLLVQPVLRLSVINYYYIHIY